MESDEYIETDWSDLRPAGYVAIGENGKTYVGGCEVDEYGLYAERQDIIKKNILNY